LVNNTSAFHLAEKALVFPVPGITVSNNKKQMLRDAKKKYAEYAAERQKYDCEIMSSDVSDSCAAINKKIMRLDEFTTMVNNTSAFHWEEKASALLVPGIKVSNNKKKMLRNAKKKGVELLKEQQKLGCKP